MLIVRLVGGIGDISDIRTFNSIEMGLLSEHLNNIVPFIQSVWGESINLKNSNVSLYSGEFKPDNRISFRETYVLFTIYFYFGDGELLRLIVAYPNKIIRNLLSIYRDLDHEKNINISLEEKTMSKIYL